MGGTSGGDGRIEKEREASGGPEKALVKHACRKPFSNASA